MEQLWNKLTEQGLYTKSFGEFKRKYNNVDGVANLHSKLVEMGLYTKSEDELINQYGFDIPKQVESKVPDGTGPTRNADWEAVKASYVQSPLKHVDMSLPADHSHDEEQATEAVADPNYFTQVADEATSIEDMYAVTDEEKANISETAESTYNAYTQLEESYNNITDKDRKREEEIRAQLADEARQAQQNNPRNLENPNFVSQYVESAIKTRYNDLPSQIESSHEVNKNNYFNQKLTIAKRRWLKENNVKLDTPEGQAALKQLEGVTLADIESDKVQAIDAGGTSLSTVFNSIPNDDPEFKQAVVDTEARTERNAVIRGKAANIANELDKSGTAQEGASFWGGLLFDQSKEQVDLAEQAQTDLWNIEQAARKKSLEGDVIFQQYEEAYSNITEISKNLKEIGDPKSKIDEIKAKYDLTTQEGVDAANEEITTFINNYESLITKHNKGLETLKDLTLASSQIKDELGNLSVREQDLDAFTNQIGKNHRLATQMSNAFAQNAVDLLQGGADLVYMVNPLGALADELIDYAGEDSYIGTVVETARALTAPITGGMSLYSGERRDDIKKAVDGYQEHVNSMVAEPIRYEDIDSVGSAIEWGLVTGATQAPQLALLMATGGTSGLIMMGGMAAGQKYSAMEDQRELYKKTGGLYGQDHNFATMVGASLASGAIESLSERVTLGLMKGTGGVASNLFFKQQGKDVASTFFRRNVFDGDKLKYAGKKLIDISEEGGSEALATIGGNYIDRLAGDKTVNLLSGVEESFVTGALIGTTLSIPTVFRDVHSSFKSVETAEVLEANYQKILEQSAIINKAKEGSPEYIAAKDLIEQLVEQNAAAIAIDVKRVDSLKDPEKKRLVEIETENRKLIQQAQEIAQSDMSEAEQERQGQALADRYNNNIQEKNDIIAQYPADEVLRAHELELQRLQAQSDAIEAEGGAPVNVTRAKSKTDEDLVVEFDAWKKQAEAKGNVRIAASEDGTQVYGAMVPVLNDAGEVTSYEMFFNEKNIFEDGKTTTASHELLHAAVFNTIRANPVLRRRFGTAIENILDGPGVKINEEARKDLKRVKRYGKTARGEEIFAIVSEQMVKGNITIDGGAVGRMKDLMRRTSMSITDTDIQFNDDTDVRNFLKDYSRSRTKGINDKRITSLFVQGAKGKIVETPATREEARKIVEEAYEEQAIEDYENTLAASIRETPDLRQEFDQLVKNEDGTPKFATNQDFRNQASPEAYLKIMDTPLLNGLIQQGMIERGLPPAALRDFTYKVKENIGFRLLKNYDVTKNDSLFGWLTGVSGGRGESIIYRAKGDVMNQYKKDGELETVSLDAPIGETTSFEATIEAETDALMQQLDEMDITAKESDMVGPKKVVETIGLSETSVNQIESTIEAADLDISGLTYKGVKKLVNGKDAPLSSVLDVVSREFGVDASRIVKPADLNSKQRTAAQEFIKKNSSALLEMLPEGETRGGEATGVANTKLGEMYKKGERLKYAEGASAAGKFTQMKRSDISTAEFNEMFGIREDGTFDNNRKYDGAIKALVNQAAMVAANQSLRENAIRKGTHPMSTIALLGDGKSEAMFSVKLRETSNKKPELGVYVLEKLRSKSGKLYEKSGNNTRAVLENIFAEELANKTIPKSLITGLTSDINRIGKRFANIPSKDIVFKGKPVGEIIVDQLQYETENARQYYKTIVEANTGETDLQSTTDPEYVSLFRTNVLNRMSKQFGPEWMKKYIYPGAAAPAKIGKGQYVFTGINEYELSSSYDSKSTDRKGVTGSAADTNLVLGTEGIKVKGMPSIATKGQLTSEDIDKSVRPNVDAIVKSQQENNQAFRDVINWLKGEFGAKRISASEVVTFLELMNANPKGLTRSAAILDFLPVEAFEGKATLEHMTPALVVNFYALTYITSGNSKVAAKNFTDVMDNYRVAYLPEKYDKIINEYYKSNMPRYWTPDMPPLLRYYNPETHKFFDLKLEQLSTGDVIGPDFSIDQKAYDKAMDNKREALKPFVSDNASAVEVDNISSMLSEVMMSKRPKTPKGASVWDFDDTLATTKSNVLYTAPNGTKGKLNAEEYARDYVELAAQGYEFDFSEFNKVVGGQPGPLFNEALERAKKFGLKDQFILTARPPAAQEAIHEFLKGVGLEIPAKNIIGLGNSTGAAKANWIAENLIKEGYNDLYFADDAIQNVEAVKTMFDLFDIKGKVQQAKVEFSKQAPKQMDNIIDEGAADLDSDFNIILEETKGVARFKQFSAGKARQRGKNKGKFKFFIPPSADDFAGLLYSFMGKGKQGDKHHKFFKVNLFDPFSKGIRLLNRANQIAANDLKNLRKAFPSIRNKLKNKLPGLEYTVEDAIRVYNWNQLNFDVPGLSQADLNAIVKAIEGDASLKAFADGVSTININEPIAPDDSWLGGTIASDINDALETARSTYLQEWIDNKNAIFTEANMNKIEAVYGSNFREALEDVLYRMENGGNRSQGQGRLMNNFTNWIHGSIGTTMFFNARSAMLQMISNVNFINWSDNNMLAAAKAFANQPQYWKDVAMIFNSDFLKQRRGRIQTDVNAAELLAEIRDSKNPMKKATAYLLQLGFTPTQIADSFAIATGGATFYRNRVDSYIKEGMSKKDAETKAFEDMMEIAEETQQSTREDRISQQQASPLGKFILAFQNTPMQYNRLIKKAAQDLVNRRGSDTANVSKIVYYGAIQNMIFYGLQQALFAAMFGGDEEDKLDDDKKERVINGMLDTVLRGSGIAGAVVSTTKNVILRFMKEEEKADDDKFFTEPDHAYTVIEALNISPPIGIKARKLYSALQSWEFNRDVIDHMDKTDIDNPIYDAVFSATEAITNIPLSRLHSKYQNIKEAANSDHETWKRVAMLLGWSKWNFGIKNQDVMTAKNEIKEIKAEEKEERQEQKKIERQLQKADEELQVIEDNKLDQDEKREEGATEVQCAAVSRSGKRCSNMALPGKDFCTIHESVPQQEKEVQCSHIKKDGKRCKMKTKNKSGKCYYHD